MPFGVKNVENSVENVENGLGKPFAGFIFTGDNLRLTVRRIVKFLGRTEGLWWGILYLTSGLTGIFCVLGRKFFWILGRIGSYSAFLWEKILGKFFVFDHCKPVGKCGIVYAGRNGREAGACGEDADGLYTNNRFDTG